jgi:eukaryotic-like serine/threonine-protein kinase
MEAIDPKAPVEYAICLKCGSHLQATGLGLLCPACLMEQLLSSRAPETPKEAQTFGDYQLLEELGRGGVGVVYRAWHNKLERTVALKMLLGGQFASPELNAQFAREVKVIARLRHPGIVALHETGEIDGIRFFTMELVEGRTLASLVRDGPLAVARACAYTRKAALAVEHAHGLHILHRDLKPSNILIDLSDDPKVADFGLARFWSAGAEPTSNLGLMGSPPYMAPEQVSGEGGDVGPAADIYALGAMLYHLLTGRPPHQGSRIEEVLAQVRESHPVAPRLLNPGVPRDLETICLKCLEKDPGRRYASAADLAADLGRFERGEPVIARPVGVWGRTWRWSRRNRSLAAALGALALVVLAGAVAVVLQAAHNRRERDRLELEAYATGMHAASLAVSEGDYPLARTYLAAAAPAPGRADHRGFEWRVLWAATEPQAESVLRPHRMEVEQLAFSPDGRRLATNSLDGTASWVDLAAGGTGKPVSLGAGGGWALAYAPGGGALYVGARGAPGGTDTVRLEDAVTGRTLWSTPGWRLSPSGDGKRVAIDRGQPLPWVRAEGGVDIWDAATHRVLLGIDGDYRSAALSPDGRLVALAPADGSVRLRAADDNRELAKLPTGGPQALVVFSPDGSLLASCGLGEAYLWRVADRSLVAKLPHPWLRVWAVAFSPDSTRLATTCSDRAVRVWDTSGGRCLRTLRGHADEVWSVAFSPDGTTLASGGKDGSVLLWRVNSASEPLDVPYHGWSRPIFSPDGRTLVVAEGYFSEQYALIQREGRPLQRGPRNWSPRGFSADGSRLLVFSEWDQPALRWWDIATGEFGTEFEGAENIPGLTLAHSGLSPDGAWVFQVGTKDELTLWDAAGGRPVRRLALPPGGSAIRSMALSRDAKWFAWCREADSEFWLADLVHGGIRALAGHRNTVSSVAFSPSGEQLASASADGSVRVWDCSLGSTTAVFPGHPESADDVAFSPDGKTLASLGSLQSLKLWYLPTRSELVTLEIPDAGSFLSFSPDGSRLAVTLGDPERGGDKGARIFEAPGGAPEN